MSYVRHSVQIINKKPDGTEYSFLSVMLMSCDNKVHLICPTTHDRKLYEEKDPRRHYIKVHDPKTCVCSWMIAKYSNTIIQLPDTSPQLGIQVQRKAGIFNSLFFLRKDGIWRNALGEVLARNDIEQSMAKLALKSRLCKLSELIRMVEASRLQYFLIGKEAEILHRWMEFDAETVDGISAS